MKAKDVVLAALTAGLYAVITWAIAPWAYGPMQLRVSELLKPLALRGRAYVAGLALGLLIANLGSPYAGAWELFVMPLACGLGGEIAYRLRERPLVALVVYACWVGLAVGTMLHTVLGLPWLPTVASVFVPELILMLAGWRLVDYVFRRAEAERAAATGR